MLDEKNHKYFSVGYFRLNSKKRIYVNYSKPSVSSKFMKLILMQELFFQRQGELFSSKHLGVLQ